MSVRQLPFLQLSVLGGIKGKEQCWNSRACVCVKVMHIWSKPTEEMQYNPRKTTMVVNPSLMVKAKDMWSNSVQESMYEPSKATMVVHYSPAAALLDMRSLPTQETNYNQAKSVMVLAINAVVPTYMKTPSVPSTQ